MSVYRHLKMKRKQTSLTPFLDKKVCQGKAIYINVSTQK